MRRRFWLILTAWLLIALGATAPAHAATGSVSYSFWNVEGSEVRVMFILPVEAAKRLVPDSPRLDSAHASAAAGALLGVGSDAGDCTPVIQNQWVGEYYILAPENGAYRFEMSFLCPTTKGIALRDRVLFDKSPDHVDYAKIQVGRGAPVLRLFTRTHQQVVIPADGPVPSETLGPFARQGLNLLSRDAAAIALVAGLLLVSRRWRDLIVIILALALGYAAAFAVVWSSALTPSAGFAEAGMGATAAILGLCALRRQALEQAVTGRWAIGGRIAAALVAAALVVVAAFRGWPALFAALGLVIFGFALAWFSDARARPSALLFAPAALFGLLDGTVWAQRLGRLQMPGQGLGPALLGYDLGAIAGLAAAAGVVMALAWLLGRKLQAMRPFGADLAAAALTGLGVFWFVSRLYSV